MFIRIIINILFDSRCILCSKKLQTWQSSLICEQCMKYFDQPDDKKCRVCGHPVKDMGKCSSCSRLGEIYYDSYRFVQYYTGFLKRIIIMLKISQKYLVNKLFFELFLKKGLIKKDGIITVVPDNPLKRIKKGRSGMSYLLKLFKSKKFKVIAGVYKKRFRLLNSQKNKNDYGRLSKINSLFYLPEKNINKYDGKVYLLDDIYTSGSTVNYGAKLLKQAGFKEVHVVSFFRSILNN